MNFKIKTYLKRNFIFIFIGIFVTYITLNFLKSDYSFKSISEINVFYLLVSVIFYFISIGFDAIRLFYLSDESTKSLKTLFLLQFQATSLQLLLPFRLGDFFRVYLFKKYLNGIIQSAFIFAVEKFFDIIATISILLIWLIPNRLSYFQFLANYKLLILISLSISIIIVIPDIFEVIYKHLLVYPNGKFKKKLIKFLFLLLNAQKRILYKLKGKLINTLLISYICWVFNSLSFIFITEALGAKWDSALIAGPLVALSSVLPSPPLGISGSVTIGLYWTSILTGTEDLLKFSFSYSLLIYGFFILIVGIITIINNIYFRSNEK
tara:strand:- start:1843 stop:2808 length:966 start_codon:yes stop_codon:yes gene_type:complete